MPYSKIIYVVSLDIYCDTCEITYALIIGIIMLSCGVLSWEKEVKSMGCVDTNIQTWLYSSSLFLMFYTLDPKAKVTGATIYRWW
jgi:hypothetical protein